jgi:hypothetical protein
MVSGVTIGYVNFTIFLLVLTGILMLRIDVPGYRMGNEQLELKVSRFMGWFNIVAGLTTLLGNWVYQNIVW